MFKEIVFFIFLFLSGDMSIITVQIFKTKFQRACIHVNPLKIARRQLPEEDIVVLHYKQIIPVESNW